MIKLKENEIILFSGDSITDGGRSRNMDLNHYMGHGFPYILSAKMSMENLSRHPKFINKGYGGEGICSIYSKWYDDVIKNKPTMINILIGVNDIFSGNAEIIPNVVRRYSEAYEMMLKDTFELLDKPVVILCEPFLYPAKSPQEYLKYAPHMECEKAFIPLNINLTESDWEYRMKALKDLQKVVFELAGKYNCIFVPLQKAFEQAIGNGETEYMLWDGCHPTVAGHGLIAEQWYKCVEKEIDNM